MNLSQTNDNVLTVSQLTGLIKTLLEGTFASVELKGEISNFKPNASSGHLYFVLKDSESQITAVMFRGKAQNLQFKPKDGMLVHAKGNISVYPPRGNYQIIISSMEKAGTGDIMELIEERKRKLQAEGLFSSERKRPIPRFPNTIGIVTSPTGAALRDILNITLRRNNSINVTIFPSLVQGEAAASSIVKMIKIANDYNMCDVLIVGRGGGSLEDLLPFSDEDVVRAVANSKIPVISAVGHEIDWALCDFAADVRAPTPSAAAELAVPIKTDTLREITRYSDELLSVLKYRIDQLKLMLKTFTPENMELQFRRIEQPLLQKLDFTKQDIIDGLNEKIRNTRLQLENARQTLEHCNPQTIFDRGYSMVVDSNGTVIRSASKVQVGQELCIKPAIGTIKTLVTKIETKKAGEK